MTFRNIKPGDVVTRMLAGTVEMPLRVTEVTDDLILCGPKGEGWAFDRDVGWEEDPDLGWGRKFKGTGSYLKALLQ